MSKDTKVENTKGNGDLAVVRQRIIASELLKTTPEIFEREADEFAKFMVKHFDMDIINKMLFFQEHSLYPFCKYVA